MPLIATILGQGPSSLGTTLALLITFLGIGLVMNVLVVYIIGQILVERKQNQERRQDYLS